MVCEPILEVTREKAGEYFARLDPLVAQGTVLYIYGGAAVALLGSGIRTTMDVDVAEPYSHFDRLAFASASERAGLPINPKVDYEAAFLELVGEFRLCVPKPTDDNPGIELFKGINLTVRTGSAADLIASKLIRYDEQDQQDIQFLLKASKVNISAIKESVSRLPDAFCNDVLVKENLDNLERDMNVWGIGS